MRYYEETEISISDGRQCCGHWIDTGFAETVIIGTSFQSKYTEVKTARSYYRFYNALGRLIAGMGIDNRSDIKAFIEWYSGNWKHVSDAYARYKGSAGVPATFAEFCSQAFLDWLEPMSEDDKQAQREYNIEEVQHWLVLGLENSAMVDLDFGYYPDQNENDETHRITYTPGDYPTFKTFGYITWVNKEIEKWTNFLPR